MKNAIKDGGNTTMHSKVKVGKKDGLDLKTFFSFGFREFLENFQEILNYREFSRNFTSRSRSRGIFISLFTSRKEWIRFLFHFSFLEKSESDFHFTFHLSKRVNHIFISLFTSRKEWNRFSFHFSLLELSITTLAGHCERVAS